MAAITTSASELFYHTQHPLWGKAWRLSTKWTQLCFAGTLTTRGVHVLFVQTPWELFGNFKSYKTKTLKKAHKKVVKRSVRPLSRNGTPRQKRFNTKSLAYFGSTFHTPFLWRYPGLGSLSPQPGWHGELGESPSFFFFFLRVISAA